MTQTSETPAIRELTADEMTQAGGSVIIERGAQRGIVQRGIIVQ
jgi:hypothetical protein